MVLDAGPFAPNPFDELRKLNLENLKEYAGDDLNRVHWLPPILFSANRVRCMATSLIGTFSCSLRQKKKCTTTPLTINQYAILKNQGVAGKKAQSPRFLLDATFQYYQWLAGLITFRGAAKKAFLFNCLIECPSSDRSDGETICNPL